MNYTSVVFLYFFLPVFMALYALVKASWRSAVMALGSSVVIAWASLAALIPMGVTVVLAYLFGRLCGMLRKKEHKAAANWMLALFVLIEAGQLVYFYVAGNVSGFFPAVLGIGIMSLNSVSYVADVNRGAAEADNNFFRIWAYVCFLPSLCGIPVVRYETVKRRLPAPHIRSDMLSDGILLMLFGIAEKVIVSDRLYELYNDILSASSGELSMIMSWMGALIFGASLYIGLKGYSHIARGFALMLGFGIERSFDLPYTKYTLKDYIGSFNISAVEYLRTYIYKPLTTVTQSRAVSHLAIAVCTILVCVSYKTSMNYLLWGSAAALLLVIESLASGRLQKVPAAVRYIFVHILTLVGWALISQSTVNGSLDYIKGMFSGVMQIDPKPLLYFLGTAFPYSLMIIVFELPFPKLMLTALAARKPAAVSILKPLFIFALLILCTAFLMSSSMLKSLL